jgi:branched-chain amino acid aminotransferase
MNIKTPYIWKNWEFINWDDAMDHNLTHSLHYWTWVFEWIRFYPTSKWPKVFRLKEHIDRLFYSASILELEIPFSKEEIMQAHIDIVAKSWVESWYLRPLVYYWTGKMGMNPTWAKVETVISAWNWGKYLADKAIDVKISKYKRMHPETADINAKVSWGYYNNVLVSLEVKKENFDEWLLLDTNWFIAEWPGENIFFIKDWKLITPQIGTILPWITRATIIQIAKEKLNIDCEETKILPTELNEFDETFFVGTAAEVTPIWSITYNWEKNIFSSWKEDSLSNKIKNIYMDIVHGRDENYKEWLS